MITSELLLGVLSLQFAIATWTAAQVAALRIEIGELKTRVAVQDQQITALERGK